MLILTLGGPTGDHDLAVDGDLALRALLPSLAAAAGLVDDGGWVLVDGERRLRPGERSLIALGVPAGSRLRIERSA